MKHIFITGVSSGIGQGLEKHFLDAGDQVYGLSRRQGTDQRAKHVAVDIAEYAELPGALARLCDGVSRLDLVILNAGILGEVKRSTGYEFRRN